jgi:hypothetical protein
MKEMDVNGYWYKTTLGELVSAKGGYGFPRELQGRKRGQVAFFKVSDMSRSGNEKWLRAANNYIDNNDMNLLKAKVFPAESVVFPKIGAAIRTNKKRILAQPSVVDNNVMVLTVKQEHSFTTGCIQLISATGLTMVPCPQYQLAVLIPSGCRYHLRMNKRKSPLFSQPSSAPSRRRIVLSRQRQS